MTFVASGKQLDSNKVEQAVQLSTEKYCGVHATLVPGVAKGITWNVEIKDVGS
jgi:uncharacterized OsmC-like protein